MNATPHTPPETLEDDLQLELIPHPLTGEALELTDKATNDVLAVIREADEWLEAFARFRKAGTDELIRRLDRAAERKAVITLGDLKVELETNAPTSEEYRVDVLEEELVALTELDDAPIEARVVGEAITWTKPAAPAKRVDKRVVNKLKRSTDKRVLAAIARARTIVNNNRTLKITPVEEGDR